MRVGTESRPCTPLTSDDDGSLRSESPSCISLTSKEDGSLWSESSSCISLTSKEDGSLWSESSSCISLTSKEDGSLWSESSSCISLTSKEDGSLWSESSSCISLTSKEDGSLWSESSSCISLTSKEDGSLWSESSSCISLTSKEDGSLWSESSSCISLTSNADGSLWSESSSCISLTSKEDGSLWSESSSCISLTSKEDGSLWSESSSCISLTSKEDGSLWSESSSCISLTSNADGSLRSESFSIFFDDLSFKNCCKLYSTVPTDNTLHLNVTGTGRSLVFITDGSTHRVPLYLLKLRHASSVDIEFHLTKSRKQVSSEFKNKELTTGVDPNKTTHAGLIVFEGPLVTAFTLNGKTVLKQTCELSEENEAGLSEMKIPDTSSLLKEEGDSVDDKGGKTDGEDDQMNITDDKDYCRVYDSSDCEELTRDVQVLKIDEMTPSDDDVEKTVEKIQQEVKVNTANDSKRSEEDIYTATTKDKNEEESDTDDDGRVSVCGSTNSDDTELNVSQSTKDERLETNESVSIGSDKHRCIQYRCCCNEELAIVTRQPENCDMVDIRTNRTELLKIMQSNRLADYFFEAALISEDDMIEITDLWRNDFRAANGTLLKILRNRKIRKCKIGNVLKKAEDSHLLELMFPKQLNHVSVATQTDDCV